MGCRDGAGPWGLCKWVSGGQLKFLAPAAGDTASPLKEPEQGEARLQGWGHGRILQLLQVSLAGTVRMIGLCSVGSVSEWRVMRVVFALAALGHGAVPLCPGVPQSQPSRP